MSRLDGFTYSPRAGTDTAKMVDIIRKNLDADRDTVVAACVKGGFPEALARSWVRGFIMNGSVPGRLPNGQLNVPNDKAENKRRAGLPAGASAAKTAATKPARAKTARKGKK